jgi:hypothetical protein
MLDLERARRLLRLVEAGLLAARESAQEGESDERAGAHGRYY